MIGIKLHCIVRGYSELTILSIEQNSTFPTKICYTERKPVRSPVAEITSNINKKNITFDTQIEQPRRSRLIFICTALKINVLNKNSKMEISRSSQLIGCVLITLVL